jgi:hypothetical protein
MRGNISSKPDRYHTISGNRKVSPSLTPAKHFKRVNVLYCDSPSTSLIPQQGPLAFKSSCWTHNPPSLPDHPQLARRAFFYILSIFSQTQSPTYSFETVARRRSRDPATRQASWDPQHPWHAVIIRKIISFARASWHLTMPP